MDKEINWEVPDWEREKPVCFWDPGRKLLKSIRDYQRLKGKTPLGKLGKKICVLRHRFWSVVSGAEISLNCQLGGGLLLPHPNGIVIHPDSVVGNNCLIFQQVTLAGPCHLGHHVDVGAGAKLLGPLSVGDHVRIGANSVVTKDLPSRVTAVGIPAKVIGETSPVT
ncbi:MAG: hypothetical protein PQJ60_01835 [Spirochaetales bacterium]|nr:hypothetical protein [Spirochaetales bacterium]